MPFQYMMNVIKFIKKLMIPVVKTRAQYQIEMAPKTSYPFNGLKPSKFMTNVKLTIRFQDLQNNHSFLTKLLNVDNQNLIKITKVTESHLRQIYTLIYEYVPYKSNHSHPKIHENLKAGKYKSQIYGLCKQLLGNGIKPQIKNENIGFNQQYKLKLFVEPSLETLGDVPEIEDIQTAANAYTLQFEKIFQSSDSGEKLKNKVSGLSQKLKKIQNDIISKQFRKKEKKMSEQGMNSSDNSDSLAKTGSNQKIGNAQWHFDHDFRFEDSYSERESKKKKRRSASFKDGEKPKSENKQKKASWEGSYKQQKSINQSDKMTVLKKRISQALFKTQKTLTKYEKIRSRTGKKVNTQNILNVPINHKLQ